MERIDPILEALDMVGQALACVIVVAVLLGPFVILAADLLGWL